MRDHPLSLIAEYIQYLCKIFEDLKIAKALWSSDCNWVKLSNIFLKSVKIQNDLMQAKI